MTLAMIDSSLCESDPHSSEGVGVHHAVSERVGFGSGTILSYILGWWVADLNVLHHFNLSVLKVGNGPPGTS